MLALASIPFEPCDQLVPLWLAAAETPSWVLTAYGAAQAGARGAEDRPAPKTVPSLSFLRGSPINTRNPSETTPVYSNILFLTHIATSHNACTSQFRRTRNTHHNLTLFHSICASSVWSTPRKRTECAPMWSWTAIGLIPRMGIECALVHWNGLMTLNRAARLRARR